MILYDLESITTTLDRDRNDLSNLTMSAEQRKDIQHHVARCLHSLIELEVEIESQEPGNGVEGDYFV
jgi:hypothetical protein